jgi:hypothetical protein
MKSIKSVAAAAAAGALRCAASAATASASTTLCVSGSPGSPACPSGQGPGGAFGLTSANATFNVGGPVGPVTCRSATINGTAPTASSLTSITTVVALAWSGCSGPLGVANVALTPGCMASTGAVTMTFDNNAGAPYTYEKLGQGCDIVITFLAVTCQVTVAGPQTIGNGTPGLGGQQWVNGGTTAAVPSRDTFMRDVVTYTAGPGCPSGPRTSPGTYDGLFVVTSPATTPGMTVQP